VTADGYVILAYTIGLGLLWGYAAQLWLASRRTTVVQIDRNETEVGGRP
jgi:hypothetical protein